MSYFIITISIQEFTEKQKNYVKSHLVAQDETLQYFAKFNLSDYDEMFDASCIHDELLNHCIKFSIKFI